MALMSAYLQTAKNIESFFSALIKSQTPERFTIKHLENMGFKSTNDRLFIGILKGLSFIDENGIPTAKYSKFLDGTESKRVLAESLKEAYSDLFTLNKEAYKLSYEEVKNKFKSLTEGKKSENVLSCMATTFKGLADWADWKVVSLEKPKEEQKPAEVKKMNDEEKDPTTEDKKPNLNSTLHYNIQIHLPETKDSAVYDAIFKSLKEHLL